MRQKKSNMSWFKCKVTYEKDMYNGTIKSVTESYLVSAESFTDAETILTTEILKDNVIGECVVKSIQKMNLYDLLRDSSCERFYKVKVGFLSLDEKSGVEKRKYVQMIVQEDSIGQALKKVEKELKDTTFADFEVHTISESDIIIVI